MKLLGVACALMFAFASLGIRQAEASNLRQGSNATTTASLNLRYGPNTSYNVARTMPDGAQVYVDSGPYNGYWYKVTYYGTTGYAHGGWLTQGGSGGSGGSSAGSYSSKGAAIAATAKQYVGYAYSEYGNSPYEGFNCVGLSQWALSQNGVYVSQSLWGQYNRGAYVSRDNLQPGDVVFFQNTWWSGLSHSGVYVGNGWMVDASTPSTGVVWSNIYSSYYYNKWFGARRIYS